MESEQERANFYQQHKEDPDVWEEPESPVPAEGRKGLSISITVRFPAEEAALIRRMAEDLGVTYSDLVRKAVSQYVRPTFELKVTEGSSNIFYNLEARRTGSIQGGIKMAQQDRPSSYTAPSGATPR